MTNKTRFKNVKIGLISSICSGLLILVLSLMFMGWENTLVKKNDLLEKYPDRKEIASNYVSIAEYNIIKERSQTLVESVARVEEKLDLILIHNNISYQDKNEFCPFPPCQDKKPKKDKRMVKNGG